MDKIHIPYYFKYSIQIKPLFHKKRSFAHKNFIGQKKPLLGYQIEIWTYISVYDFAIPTNYIFVKIHVRWAAGRKDIPIFTCDVCWLLVCTGPPGKTETIQTWNLVHTLLFTISKNGFLVLFRKSDPEGRLPQKTAVSRGFSAYLLDCLVYLNHKLII